jgi:hypothetical protein
MALPEFEGTVSAVGGWEVSRAQRRQAARRVFPGFILRKKGLLCVLRVPAAGPRAEMAPPSAARARRPFWRRGLRLAHRWKWVGPPCRPGPTLHNAALLDYYALL